METAVPDLSSNPPAFIEAARKSGDAGELLNLYRNYLKVLARVQIGKHLQGKTDCDKCCDSQDHRPFILLELFFV